MLAAEKHLWAVAVVLASCAPSNRAAPRPLPETTGSTSDVDELVALANLYGVIRYFHPTDAGATVDWPAFLVESVEPTIAGRDAQSLATALSTRFEPLMSGVRLGPAEAEIESPASGPHEVVWQHLGYGATSMPGVYRSKRTRRTTEEAPPGASVATIAQKLDATWCETTSSIVSRGPRGIEPGDA